MGTASPPTRFMLENLFPLLKEGSTDSSIETFASTGGKRNFRSRPSIPVMDLFPSGEFPEGEIQQHKDDNLWRITSEEKRALDRLAKPMYNSVRQAAEVHRQVRKCMKSILKPGMLMTDPCENTVRKLISEKVYKLALHFLLDAL